jgi:5'-methylthioadenosine phosphorylase
MSVKLGIIGGSGIADAGFFEVMEQVEVETPHGKPSAPYAIGKVGEVDAIFLPRHGIGHKIPPHDINFRANVWGMKHLGAYTLICPSAVGSLKEDYKPGDICITDQFIDFTKNRKYTFFDTGKVKHVSTADPFCEELRQLLIDICREKEIPHHDRGTYVCIEGPRFSTRAESRMFRNYADIIGMTMVPEVQLCRELGLCYANLSMITDYDVWAENPVNIAKVIKTMKANVEKIHVIIETAAHRLPGLEFSCECEALADEAEF